MGEFTKEQIAQLSSAINPVQEEVLLNPIKRLAQQTKLFDEQRKAFTEAGYAQDLEELGSAFSSAAAQSLELFGNTNRATDALTAFRTNAKAFVYMSDAFRSTLLETTVAMQGLGFEATTLAEVVDSGMYAFGSSADELKGLMAEFANMSETLAIPGDTLAKNFRSAQQNFAYNTKIFKQNFKELQVMSRQTGLSFDSLTSTFGSSFDSFEGAAQKAGQLNQILGKSAFNSIEMLNMTEAQRAKRVKKEFGDRDPNEMGKFELMAVQETLGFGSVEDTRKFLRTGKRPGAVDSKKYGKLEGRFDNSTEDVKISIKKLSDSIRRGRGPVENSLVALGNMIQDSTKNLAADALTKAVGLKFGEENTKELQKKIEISFESLNTMQKSQVSQVILMQKDAAAAMKVLKSIKQSALSGFDRNQIGIDAKDIFPHIKAKLVDAEKNQKKLLDIAIGLTAAAKLAGTVHDFTGIPKAFTTLVALEKMAEKAPTEEDYKALGEALKGLGEGLKKITGLLIAFGASAEKVNAFENAAKAATAALKKKSS